MEKLKHILHSEEYARDRAQEARERAVELERAAVASAAQIRQATLGAAREEARAATAMHIDAARADALDYEQQAAAAQALLIERAAERIDMAAVAVLRELAD